MYLIAVRCCHDLVATPHDPTCSRSLTITLFWQPKNREIRSLQAILALLRCSTERMAPRQRSKFLEAAMRPALGTLRRIFDGWAGKDPRTRNVETKVPATGGDDTGGDDDEPADLSSEGEEDEDDEFSTAMTTDAIGGGDDYAKLSPGTREAAVKTAEAAADFIGPLLRRAGKERERAYQELNDALPLSSSNPGCKVAAEATPEDTLEATRPTLAPAPTATVASEDGPRTPPMAPEDAAKKVEAQEAADRSLASFLAYALSALSMVAGKSSVVVSESDTESKGTPIADPTAASAPVGSAASCASSSDSDEAESLAKAEGRLVRLIVSSASAIDLQFVLLHAFRASYAKRVRERRSGERAGRPDHPPARQPVPLPRSFHDRSRLGELLASGDDLHGVNLGVSAVAHLVRHVFQGAFELG